MVVNSRVRRNFGRGVDLSTETVDNFVDQMGEMALTPLHCCIFVKSCIFAPIEVKV
jgi:hypothetical protein